MKFDEYYMRNTFLEKSYTNCDRETYSRLFFQKIKVEHKFHTVFFMSKSRKLRR